MGARNVSSCFTVWGHLPATPFRLLVGMALQSLDQVGKDGQPPRMWFGGQDAMTELVGSRTAAYRALSVLREKGAVEVLAHGRYMHRASYRLNLDAMDNGETLGPESGTQQGPGIGTDGSRNRDATGSRNRDPYKNTHDPSTKSPSGEEIAKATTSPGDLEPVENPDIHVEGKVHSVTEINDYLARMEAS